MEQAPQQIIDWIKIYSPRELPKDFIIGGVIKSDYLPSYVDDVLEFANFASLPTIGETSKIYITLNDNVQYRWTDSTYVALSAPSWNKTGNAGTNPLTDFIGTTDNQDLVFKRNGSERLRINEFTTDVNGTARFSGNVISHIEINNQVASYTLTLSDNGKLVEINSSSANSITIPTNAAVAFPVGTQIVLTQLGSGQTTITPASGVTIRSNGGKLKLTGQYSGATIIKKAADEWYLFGDITT